MRELVSAMAGAGSGPMDNQMAPNLRDVDDHVQRAVESVDSPRSARHEQLDTNLTLASTGSARDGLTTDRLGVGPNGDDGDRRILPKEDPVPGSGQTTDRVAVKLLLVLLAGGLEFLKQMS